ncbi:MAG: universal stress protein [Polyangiaceae bacterium]
MTKFAHILVPIDFGEASDLALETALALASKFDATVTLLHASWVPTEHYALSGEGIHWPVAAVSDAARKSFDAALAEAKLRYPRVDGVFVTAEPRHAILDVATGRKCDLIVMGTHGRRGLTRVLMGSVAERVVRTSPIPVLTLSGKAEREQKQRLLPAPSTDPA